MPMLFCSGVCEGSEARSLRTIKPQDDCNVWIERLTSNLVLHSLPFANHCLVLSSLSARHPSQHLDSTVGLDTTPDSMDILPQANRSDSLTQCIVEPPQLCCAACSGGPVDCRATLCRRTGQESVAMGQRQSFTVRVTSGNSGSQKEKPVAEHAHM